MKQILRRINTFRSKHKEITAAAMGLLVVVLLSVSVMGTLVTQEAAAMENPVQGIAEDRSLVQLTSTKEVLAEAPEGLSLEAEAQNDLEETDRAEQSNQDSAQSDASGSGSDNTSQTGSGQGSGIQGNQPGNDGDNKTNKPNDNKDLDDDGDKDEYFKTSIRDGDTLTTRNLEYAVVQLTDLEVKAVQDKVNNGVFSTYSGKLNLAVGENTVTVRVTYLGTDGKTFHVDKTYQVFVNIDDIVIKCQLKDGETVKEVPYTFVAYAERNGKRVELKINVENSDGVMSQKSTDDRVTLTDLALGENRIYLSAEDGGESVTADIYPYTLTYEDPKTDPKGYLVVTNLEDGMTVYNKRLEFLAQGFHGSQVNVEVEGDWKNVEPVEDKRDTYLALLEEGENTIAITPYDDLGSGETQVYKVTFIADPYQNPNISDEEIERNAPTIICPELEEKDGTTVSGALLTFQVEARDRDGNSIPETNITASCNSVPCTEMWADGGVRSFCTELAEGPGNTILVHVRDEEGYEASKVYTVGYQPQDAEIPAGTVNLLLEAGTIGMGTLLNEEVEYWEGDTIPTIIERAFEGTGYQCDWEGSESQCYLAAIVADHDFVTPAIPEDLAEKMLEINEKAGEEVFYPDSYYTNSLGEFDFSQGSGWMYSVDGVYPNYSMGAYGLHPGNTIRLRFTLYYGADIGGSGAMGNGTNKPGTVDGFGKEW